MVTIWFELNEENIEKGGYTIEKVEKYLRDFYEKRGAVEVEYLTFRRDDEHAMAALSRIGQVMRKDSLFLSFIEKCVWDVDGEVEDYLQEIKEYIAEHDD